MTLSDFIKQLQDLERNGYGEATVVQYAERRGADYVEVDELRVRGAKPMATRPYYLQAECEPGAVNLVLVR